MEEAEPNVDEAVTRLLAGVDQPGPVEIEQALAGVEAALFGGGSRAVRLARYILLDRLGSGGAGVVYSAFDPELDRKVAIKLLRPGGDGTRSAQFAREALTREARALARLSHPNVVAVYDVGTFDASAFGAQLPAGANGQRDGLFLVMELVGDTNLAEWLRSTPSRERILDVFIRAGRGLAAAHASGVVHRDFKPANVLVGDNGTVRVVDFGLARWETPSVTEGEQRAIVVEGTPRYMAPEQHAGGELDARADQYGFCVSLYEALCGAPPFPGATLAELGEAKKKPPVPPPESARVPAWLWEVLRRGLDPDPARRYPSMGAVMEALERTPERRRRRMFAMVGALALVVAGLGARAWVNRAAVKACDDQSARLTGVWDPARRGAIESAFEAAGRPYATDTLTTVADTLDRHAARWQEAQAAVCRDSVDGRVPSGVLDRRLACLDRGLRRMSEVTRFLAAADAGVVERGVSTVRTLSDPRVCLEASVGDDDADLDLLASLDLADTLLAAGRYREALERGEAARQGATASSTQARARLVVGTAHRQLGEADAAEAELFEAFVVAERANRPDTAAAALTGLAAVIRERDGMGDAPRRWVRLAEAKLQSLAEPRPSLEANLRLERGAQAWDDARYDDALDELESALVLRQELHPDPGPEIADIRVLRGQAYYKQRRFEEARRELERAMDAWRGSVGARHPAVAESYRWLGNIAWRQGRYDEALRLHQEGLGILQQSLGERHARAALAMMGVSNVLTTMKRREEALDVQRRAVAILREEAGPDHWDLATNLTNLAVRFNALGRHREALQAARETIEIEVRGGADGLPRHAYPYLELSEASRNLGAVDDAVRYARRAAEIWTNTLGPRHPKVAWAQDRLGWALLERGDREDAVTAFESALELFDPDVDDPRTRAKMERGLARALLPVDVAGATARARSALQTYRSLPYAEDEAQEVVSWMEANGLGGGAE